MPIADYGQATALHYDAWRPPLHTCILATGIACGEHFQSGLDVGCGTGHSSYALAKYCNKVKGIDPEKEMIALAKPNEKIAFSTESLTMLKATPAFDIVTFSGSLHYADPAQTIQKLSPLLSKGATIIAYDFDVRMDDYFNCLGFVPPPTDYDHQAGFTDLSRKSILQTKSVTRGVSFIASAGQLAHLFLSLHDFREWAEDIFRTRQPHSALSQRLSDLCSGEHRLSAKTYLTRYTLGH